MAEIEENIKTYANAAGGNDIVIQVENPLPIAKYQPVGKVSDPLRADLPSSIKTTKEETDGSITLSVNVDAASYQWYILSQGYWEVVNGATSKDFIADTEDYDAYDFRCVYTIDGVAWSTDSVKGVLYIEPEHEVLKPIPSDLDLNPKTTYTTLDLLSADEGEFAGHVFELIFAEGEWVNDVARDMWYTNAIIWAAENKLVEGLSASNFGVADSITREQLATILCRYAVLIGQDISPVDGTELLPFIDTDSISDYAAAAMTWAVKNGIITGKSGKVLDPKGVATRSEVAIILMRFAGQ